MDRLGINRGMSPDYIIVGLGNPGPKYENTRSNIGFKVIDYLNNDSMMNFGCRKAKHSSLTDKCVLEDNVVLYLKPQMYISNSGMAVEDALDYYRMKSKQLVVIHDDLLLPSGCFEIVKGGDMSAHKGLSSIVEYLGKDDFIRIKVGVGLKPEECELSRYVLEIIPEDEYKKISSKFPSIRDAFTYMFYYGLEESIRIFNPLGMENSCDK
ncbi:MAG: aminoacyl-tRNA hydrolase [Ruminococcaceae bacterium]|nr:aminoacyl-tRNA hydrolase [Oscillospiraceae bacterium]